MLSFGAVPRRAPLDEAECGGFQPNWIGWETEVETWHADDKQAQARVLKYRPALVPHCEEAWTILKCARKVRPAELLAACVGLDARSRTAAPSEPKAPHRPPSPCRSYSTEHT